MNADSWRRWNAGALACANLRFANNLYVETRHAAFGVQGLANSSAPCPSAAGANENSLASSKASAGNAEEYRSVPNRDG